MKGNKFLAAVLAASMAFSTVPATALNVFASTTATSTTADADAKDLPTKASVEGVLNALTTSASSTDINDNSKVSATIVEATLKTAMAAGGSWNSIDGIGIDGKVEETSDKLATSTADTFAYRTFTFKLVSNANRDGRVYTVKLSANKLNDGEAADILPTYLKNEISKHTFAVGTSSTLFGDYVYKAVSPATGIVADFNTKYKTSATASATFTNADSGVYSITVFFATLKYRKLQKLFVGCCTYIL